MSEIYDAKTFDPGKSIGHLMQRVRTETLAALDRELARDPQLAPLEVTAAQFIVIASLALGGEKSTSQLCKGISYDGGAMTRMVDRLETKGLVRRRRCENDRRLVYLELTEEGRAALPHMLECGRLVQNRFLHSFTKPEARQLEGFLSRMLQSA